MAGTRQSVIQDFLSRAPPRPQGLWYWGGTLYSYARPIARWGIRIKDGRTVAVVVLPLIPGEDRTKTTMTHRGMLVREMRVCKMSFVEEDAGSTHNLN